MKRYLTIEQLKEIEQALWNHNFEGLAVLNAMDEKNRLAGICVTGFRTLRAAKFIADQTKGELARFFRKDSYTDKMMLKAKTDKEFDYREYLKVMGNGYACQSSYSPSYFKKKMSAMMKLFRDEPIRQPLTFYEIEMLARNQKMLEHNMRCCGKDQIVFTLDGEFHSIVPKKLMHFWDSINCLHTTGVFVKEPEAFASYL